MKEVNNLLNRLGELDDAPLIWINKKVYDMAEEIKRLKEEYVMLQNASDKVEEELQQRIDKAIEFINKFNEVISKNEYLEKYKNFMIIPKELLDILKGSDKE